MNNYDDFISSLNLGLVENEVLKRLFSQKGAAGINLLKERENFFDWVKTNYPSLSPVEQKRITTSICRKFFDKENFLSDIFNGISDGLFPSWFD